MTAGETAAAGYADADQPASRKQPGVPALPAEHLDPSAATAESAWPDRQALEGPFTTRQLTRLDAALRTADEVSGLSFSVYVGELTEPSRTHAEQLHRQLPDPPRSVLLAISPNQRVLEIVTGSQARRRLPDRDCKLAALSMAAAFGGGDLAGGIISGLAQLASRERLSG